MTEISIVVVPFVTVTSSLEKRLREQDIKEKTKNIQKTTLLRPARILTRILEISDGLLPLRLKRKIIIS